MKNINRYNTIERCILVVLGNINPAILHPEWFDRYTILPPQEVRGMAEKGPEVEKEFGDVKVKLATSNIFVSGIETRLHLPSFRINATPEKFEASTGIREKFSELCTFVAAIFKILEHTPVTDLGINFISRLKFSDHADQLINSYFCTDPNTFVTIFGQKFSIDSIISYQHKDSKVRVIFDLLAETDEIGINFNYHKRLSESEGTKELISYLLDNFEPMMENADKVIRDLFGDPINEEKKDVKPSGNHKS